jgi:stress-induced morphogen
MKGLNMSSPKTDSASQKIEKVLQEYEQSHKKAKPEVKWQNSVSRRIRIIDPDFAHQSLVEREEMVWPFLERLPKEVQSYITMLLLLTPDEVKEGSLMNLEFEHPIPSRL